MALHRLVEHLVVADGRLQEGVPIHQPLAAIDFALLEQREEGLAHGPGTDLVEREAGPLPVAATAHLLQLADDPGLIGVLPLPDAIHQTLGGRVGAG